jgi:hypothetical protein
MSLPSDRRLPVPQFDVHSRPTTVTRGIALAVHRRRAPSLQRGSVMRVALALARTALALLDGWSIVGRGLRAAGGLSPLFQVGGARSVQLSLRATF